MFRGSGGDLKIERLEIGCDDFADLVPRGEQQQSASNMSNRSTSPGVKRSPLLSQMGRTTSDDGKTLKSSDINPMGVPDQLMLFLEVTPSSCTSSNRL